MATKSASGGFAPPTRVSLGVARLDSDSGYSVQAMLGPAGVKITDGYGGWEEIGRPHRKPIIDWAAGKPLRMTVQLQLENFVRGISVQPFIRALEEMARAGGGNSKPPKVRVILPAGLPRSPAFRWRIEGLDWEDGEEALAYNQAGQPTRQRVMISLVEASEDELIRVTKQRRKEKRRKTYTVKKGDTLRKIASKFKLKAREIAKLNNIRDGNKLKVGKKLKLPAP